MRHVGSSQLLCVLVCVLGSGLAAVGCGQAVTPCLGDDCPGGTKPSTPSPGATSFESDLPGSSQNQQAGGGAKGESAHDASGAIGAAPPAAMAPQASSPGSAPTRGSAASADNGNFNSADDPARAILEADIIQVQGDTLYALSRIAGLAIIDVSNPDALKLLGRYRELPAEPFELYLRDGVALVMFTGWGQYVKVADGYNWVSTSKLLALDVGDPAHVAQIGSFDVPGSISDSRMVGDVLYIAAYENGYCWDCAQNKPRTAIVSLSVGDPRHVEKIDELFYADTMSQYGSGQKSITVTDKRIYLAGPEYANEGPIGSTVQVVDISDPAGDLVEGTHVQLAGQIASRWQMDEYEGVLRTVSQPLQWWTPQGMTFSVPSVETFKVESSNKLTKLGKVDIQLPIRETLRSARFDGPRAYVITAEQKDPLFTIDLSDPAAPRQVGQLEMPGFVWHMEPRGERLLGVGYDQGNAQGALAVSLFDVKDLSNPKLLSRVNFGGTWANLPEDQDRAHKVFRVLDDAGLILVPFSGWQDFGTADGKGYYCGGTSVGGVQIIDYANDALKARGAAKVSGQARRALLQHDRLLTVSDERVQAFDFGNHDAPKQTSEVVLARQVYQAFQLDNDIVARMSYDSNNGEPHIDFVAASDAGEPDRSLSEINISNVAGGAITSQCSKSFSIEQVLTEGSQLNLLYRSYAFDPNGSQRESQGLVIIDASNAAAPKIVSDTYWSTDNNWYTYYGYYSYGYYNTGSSVVRAAHSIAFLEASWTYTPVSSMQHVRLRVLDLRDPAHVKTTTLPLDGLATYSGLLADGDMLLTSRLIQKEDDPARGRFYIDRIDVSDPSAPRLLQSVNVPGALLHYDAASGRAITSDQKRIPVEKLTAQQCYERFASAEWNYPQTAGGTNPVTVTPPSMTSAATPKSGGGSSSDVAVVAPVPVPDPVGLCNGYQQLLHLVKLGAASATLEDTLTLDEDEQVSNASAGDGVLFAVLGRGGYYGRGVPIAAAGPAIGLIDCAGPGCGGGVTVPDPSELLVLGAFGSGHFAVGHLRVDNSAANNWWGWWGSPPVYAHGERAMLVGQSDVAIIDAADPANPKLTKRVTLIASPSYVDLRDDTALLTLGAQGVQWLSLK